MFKPRHLMSKQAALSTRAETIFEDIFCLPQIKWLLHKTPLSHKEWNNARQHREARRKLLKSFSQSIGLLHNLRCKDERSTSSILSHIHVPSFLKIAFSSSKLWSSSSPCQSVVSIRLQNSTGQQFILNQFSRPHHTTQIL